MYVEMDGKPWCAASDEKVLALMAAGCRHGCAHRSRETADDHVEQIRRMFPEAQVRVVDEFCPQPNAPYRGDD